MGMQDVWTKRVEGNSRVACNRSKMRDPTSSRRSLLDCGKQKGRAERKNDPGCTSVRADHIVKHRGGTESYQRFAKQHK